MAGRGFSAGGGMRVRERTWVEVDLGAVRSNVRLLRERARPAALMAVVKADAYGHGAVRVARAALEAGAAWLGVALVGEGIRLRRAGIAAPMLVLSPPAPGEVAVAARWDLAVCVVSPEMARALGRAACGRRVRAHLKVDTGMGRVGVRGPREAVEVARTLASLPGGGLEGVFTHLATADSDPAFAADQLRRFGEVVQALEGAGLRPPLVHAANSAAAWNLPAARWDLVRTGIAIYGLAPAGTGDRPPGLIPALSWKARVSFVKRVAAGTPISYGATWRAPREAVIATLPLGYADGYPRHLSNRGQVLLGGRRAPVAGLVCMDQCMVWAGEDAAVGQEAVLIGRQGDEELSAEEVAAAAGTINYEITTRIGARVPRLYRK